MKKFKLVLLGILVALLFSGGYFIFFSESPASKYLKASCNEIKSKELYQDLESKEKLLKKLEFNLDLAEIADKEETLELSLYVDDLKSYIDFKKQSELAQLQIFNRNLTLGILRGSEEVFADAEENFKIQFENDRLRSNQKLDTLKMTYKNFCENKS
jgi:hypothetical protein